MTSGESFWRVTEAEIMRQKQQKILAKIFLKLMKDIKPKF